MKDGPNIARIASLLGDSARAEALTALMTDRALTATELSAVAGVTKQTMSAHLSKLLDARLIAVDQQGRHRYFRLADADVAHLLESLMGVAFRTGAVRLLSSPREPALRKARICYDHLAGELGVTAFENLLRARVFARTVDGIRLTPSGTEWFAKVGVDTAVAAQQRRTLCRPCMDWSERRQHLAGALGSALLGRVCNLGWAKRDVDSRVIRFTPRGQRAFLELVEGANRTSEALAMRERDSLIVIEHRDRRHGARAPARSRSSSPTGRQFWRARASMCFAITWTAPMRSWND